jgi:hypothetical protein
MALTRYWPSLVLEVGGVNDLAWEGLQKFSNPFWTLYTPNDVGVIGEPENYQPYIDSVPGAAGQPHGKVAEAGQIIQDDQGEELTEIIVAFLELNQFPLLVATAISRRRISRARAKSRRRRAPCSEYIGKRRIER